jgi:hypothetical protein
MAPMDNDGLIFPHQFIIPILYTLIQLISPLSQGALAHSTLCLFAPITSNSPPINVHGKTHLQSSHVFM